MEFAILGPLEIRRDGRPVEVAGARQRAVLAVLLLHAGEVVSTGRLLDEVWGDDQPAAGATALRVRISQLRKALGDDGTLIVSRRPGYMIRADGCELDLHRFEALFGEGDRALTRGDPASAATTLEQALSIWRGRALADLADEPFARGAVARLDELRVSARERLIDAQLALGQHGRLIATLRELVAEHPLREHLRAQLMLALYRDGRQAEALEAYRGAREALVEQIGIEPGPALRTLERQILAQDPELDGETRPPAGVSRSVLAIVEGGGDPAPLAAVASFLARGAQAEPIVAALVAQEEALARATAHLHALRGDRGSGGRAAAFVSADAPDDVCRLVADHDATIVVIAAPAGERALSATSSAMLRRVPADVALLVGGGRLNEPLDGPVVVPFAGADHDWPALETAALLARALELPLRLLGTRGRAGRRDASRLLASASLALQLGAGIASEPLLGEAGAEGVLSACAGAAFIVVGLSDRWPTDGLGRVRCVVARDARCPVLLVRGGPTPSGLAPPEARTRFTWSSSRA